VERFVSLREQGSSLSNHQYNFISVLFCAIANCFRSRLAALSARRRGLGKVERRMGYRCTVGRVILNKRGVYRLMQGSLLGGINATNRRQLERGRHVGQGRQSGRERVGVGEGAGRSVDAGAVANLGGAESSTTVASASALAGGGRCGRRGRAGGELRKKESAVQAKLQIKARTPSFCRLARSSLAAESVSSEAGESVPETTAGELVVDELACLLRRGTRGDSRAFSRSNRIVSSTTESPSLAASAAAACASALRACE